MDSTPTRITISHEKGIIECKALTIGDRREFLGYWRQARQKLSEGIAELACGYAGLSRAVAILWDGDQLFQYDCTKALALCGVDPDDLDITQLSDLLFGQTGAGPLVSLQFPTIQGNGKALEPGRDEISYYIVALHLATNISIDQAKAIVLDSTPQDLAAIIEELHNQMKSTESTPTQDNYEKPKGPPTEEEITRLQKGKEKILQKQRQEAGKQGLATSASQAFKQLRKEKAAAK